MAIFGGNLLPASFRGAPFAVIADEIGGGRRVAVHQYPGRDEPWAEDMGRAPRTFRFRGFIVDNDVVFAGGPIQLQRALLLAALERSGPGTLTHPSLGIVNVSVTRFSLGSDLGASHMSSLDVDFVESGKQSFPSLLSSSSGLLSAANLCAVALAVDGVRAIALAANAGGRRSELSSTAAAWTSQVVMLGSDATALHRLTAQLPGDYGRFAKGGNAGVNGSRATPYTATTTVQDLVKLASIARVSIAQAAAAVGAAITGSSLSYAAPLAAAIQALINLLAAACADPADAIRLLCAVLAFQPAAAQAATPIGVAFSSMVRRATVAALLSAIGDYQPTSRDDAVSLINRAGGLIDAVATIAADGGDSESYTALRTARGAVVADLRTRGAPLAQIRTFAVSAPLPAAVLAQRFYRDPARADQLVVQADPIHPLFMPTTFQALAA